MAKVWCKIDPEQVAANMSEAWRQRYSTADGLGYIKSTGFVQQADGLWVGDESLLAKFGGSEYEVVRRE